MKAKSCQPGSWYEEEESNLLEFLTWIMPAAAELLALLLLLIALATIVTGVFIFTQPYEWWSKPLYVLLTFVETLMIVGWAVKRSRQMTSFKPYQDNGRFFYAMTSFKPYQDNGRFFYAMIVIVAGVLFSIIYVLLHLAPKISAVLGILANLAYASISALYYNYQHHQSSQTWHRSTAH